MCRSWFVVHCAVLATTKNDSLRTILSSIPSSQGTLSRRISRGFVARSTSIAQVGLLVAHDHIDEVVFECTAAQVEPANGPAVLRHPLRNRLAQIFVLQRANLEADQAVSFGADHDGAPWHRRHDRAGLAFETLAISGDHRRYLALGGLGFQLGDGALTYGRERSLEFYYTTHVWRGIFLAFDIQRVTNPGYNRDRGPAVVPGARLHLEF